MNELQVVVDQKPGVIGFNFEEIRDELQARMDLYKNATFTDEYRVYAKNEVAALRKMKKAIDDKRKEVKNQYMIPYNDFEGKAKELMQIIDQPIGLISQQITEMEERRKAEKKAKIGALYDSLAGDLGDYLTLKKIYNARWENASTSMAAVRKEMEEVLSSVRKEVAMLEAMTSDAVPEALRRYREPYVVCVRIRLRRPRLLRSVQISLCPGLRHRSESNQIISARHAGHRRSKGAGR